MSRAINLNSAELRTRDATASRLYAATKPTNLVQPATYTNAAMRELLKAPVMQSPRADAGQHFEHASLGLGAQIVRAV